MKHPSSGRRPRGGAGLPTPQTNTTSISWCEAASVSSWCEAAGEAASVRQLAIVAGRVAHREVATRYPRRSGTWEPKGVVRARSCHSCAARSEASLCVQRGGRSCRLTWSGGALSSLLCVRLLPAGGVQSRVSFAATRALLEGAMKMNRSSWFFSNLGGPVRSLLPLASTLSLRRCSCSA